MATGTDGLDYALTGFEVSDKATGTVFTVLLSVWESKKTGAVQCTPTLQRNN